MTNLTVTITPAQMAAQRRRLQTDIDAARHMCIRTSECAAYPDDGRDLVAHAAHLSELLLDDWQLALIEEIVDHEAGVHGADCISGLCEIDADELAEMSVRWKTKWATLAAWLDERAAVR